jgi:hypothetical protein
MRSLKLVFFGLVMASGSVFAAPVVWTVPSTLLPGGTTVSGTFTFDAATNTLSSINITATGTNSGSYTFVDDNFSAGVEIGQLAASITSGAKVFFVLTGGLPLTGGTPIARTVGIGNCGVVTSGLCTGVFSIENAAATLTSAAVAPTVAAPIPTLSEWAMIFLASLMGMLAFARTRRQ